MYNTGYPSNEGNNQPSYYAPSTPGGSYPPGGSYLPGARAQAPGQYPPPPVSDSYPPVSGSYPQAPSGSYPPSNAAASYPPSPDPAPTGGSYPQLSSAPPTGYAPSYTGPYPSNPAPGTGPYPPPAGSYPPYSAPPPGPYPPFPAPATASYPPAAAAYFPSTAPAAGSYPPTPPSGSYPSAPTAGPYPGPSSEGYPPSNYASPPVGYLAAPTSQPQIQPPIQPQPEFPILSHPPKPDVEPPKPPKQDHPSQETLFKTEIHKVSSIFYKELPKASKDNVTTFFKGLDKDKDGKVTLKELQEILPGFKLDKIFTLLDANNSGDLDYEECVTFFYMINYKPSCNHCGDIILGTYFSCPDCWLAGSGKNESDDVDTYELCIDCYSKKEFSHPHKDLLDHNMLLFALRRMISVSETTKPTSPADEFLLALAALSMKMK